MRDLQGIAEINGPRRAELQAERAANVKENSPGTGWVLFQSLHGDRVKARQAQHAQAPYPFCRTPAKCAGKGYCPADIACND